MAQLNRESRSLLAYSILYARLVMSVDDSDDEDEVETLL